MISWPSDKALPSIGIQRHDDIVVFIEEHNQTNYTQPFTDTPPFIVVRAILTIQSLDPPLTVFQQRDRGVYALFRFFQFDHT